MIKQVRFILLSALLMVPFASHATEHLTVNSGFGGTGIISEDPNRGFGGSGRASSGFGGTGVIGTITKFGSIWVNGIEIGYGYKTDVTNDLDTEVTEKATNKAALKLGQQVILETLPNDNKALTKAIHIYYPLAGKITSMTDNSVTINNQHTVQTSDKTYYDAALNLQIGEFVAVNGYQTQENVWQATRLSENPNKKGLYQPTPSKAFTEAIKQVVIETSPQQIAKWQALATLNASEAKPNERFVVRGAWVNGQIQNTKMIQSYADFLKRAMQGAVSSQEGFDQPESIKPIKPIGNVKQEARLMQKEQIDMMQMQRDQKSMMQDQLDQVQQIQDIREQINQIRGFR